VLARELKRRKLTAYACATALGLRPPRIYELCKGRFPVTPIMALRLARYLGGDAERWLVLQARHDLSVVAREHAKELRGIVPLAEDSDS
jgi:addiction module HigA family antidote